MRDWRNNWQLIGAWFGAAIAEDSGAFGVLDYHLYLWEKYS
jgi:hypothetical protein